MRPKILATAMIFLMTPAAASQHFPSQATDWPACRLRHHVASFSRLEDMPQSVQADFRSRVGQVALPSEPFNPGDVYYGGDPTPSRRFLRGVQSGDYWFVWYEHGGFGNHRHVLSYVVSFNGESYLSGAPHRARPNERVETSLVANLTGDPCVATDAILDGVFPSEELSSRM